MSASGSKFTCNACNRAYSWKPELAGKKVRCKCGQVLAVPQALVASVPPPAPELDDMYELAGDREEKASRTPQASAGGGLRCPSCQSDVDAGAVICMSCGMNFKTGKKMRTSVGGPDLPAPALARPAVAMAAGVAPAAVAGGVPRTLGYAGRNPQVATKEADEANAALKQLTVPIIFVAIGLVLAVTRSMLAFDTSLPMGLMITGLLLVVDMFFITIGCLIAIKVLDIALGAPAEAFLKICAVSLLPGAVTGLIEYKFGLAGGMIGWGVALALYYTLLKIFFDLELFEVLILTTIIWLVRTWIGMVVAAIILAMIMGGSASNFASGPMTTMMGAGGENEIVMDGSPAGRNNIYGNALILRADAQDAKAFIAASPTNHLIDRTHEQTKKVFDDLYAAGAEQIWVSQVYSYGERKQADKVVILLPDEPELRAKIFPIWKDYFAPKDLPPIADMGEDQAYLILNFDAAPD